MALSITSADQSHYPEKKVIEPWGSTGHQFSAFSQTLVKSEGPWTRAGASNGVPVYLPVYAGTELYRMVIEADARDQLAQGCTRLCTSWEYEP